MSERFNGVPLLDIYGDELNKVLYEEMLLKKSSASYRIMKETVNFERIEEACVGYHKKPTHKGIVHPVRKMVRVLFLKEWHGWSLRKTWEQMESDLRCKWFAGYGVFEGVPDYTTLDRFEQYVMKTCPRVYFDEMLSAIEAKYPERAKPKQQLGDTLGMRADAELMNDIPLLRRLCEKLLDAAASAGHLPPATLDQEKLFGKKKETWRRKTKEEKEARRLNVVREAYRCVMWVEEAHWSDEKVTDWMRVVKKHVSDEYVLTLNEEKVVESVRLCTKKERGSYRVRSATDVEATFRYHGKDDVMFGYNIQVATDDAIVREICATTGSTPDQTGIQTLLEEQKKNRGYVPEQMIYDRAGGTAKTMGEVARVTEGETELVARPVVRNNNEEKEKKEGEKLFTTQQFMLIEKEGEPHNILKVVCPNGVESTAYSLSGSGDGYNFRYRKKVECVGCPLIQQCYKTPEEQARKQVFIHFNRKRFDWMRLYVETDEGKAALRKRPIVERIIASLVNHNGARRAKRRGLKAADFQAKMAGMAHNVKWLVKQIKRQEKQQREERQKRRRKGGVCLAPT